MTTLRRPRRTRRRCRDERGSVTIWAVLASLCLLLILGVAVDLTGHARAEQHARSVAFEAARSAAQQLDADDLATGAAVRIDPGQAASAAAAYLAAAGMSGQTTTTVETVTVRADDTYACQFLSVIGVGSLPVHGSAQVEIHRVLEGRPR